jgi:hypothetical protein
MTTAAQIQQQPIRSTIPARLDRLRWSPFHTRLVLGLGTAWVLDGLSITIASSVTSKLTQPDTLHLTTTEAASIGPAFYGVLIGNGSNRANLAIGYLVGGGIMIIGGVVEALIGINAEGKPLEQIAPPLTEVDTAG